MGAFEWTLVGLIVLGIAAVLIRPLLQVKLPSVSFDNRNSRLGRLIASPRRLLKREIKRLGGRPRKIPAQALDDIVARKIELAEELAASGLSAYADPRKTLARELHGEASNIVRLMRGERLIRGAEDTLATLVKYGVLRETAPAASSGSARVLSANLAKPAPK